MNFHQSEGVGHVKYPREQYDLVWPDLSGRSRQNYTTCTIAILVAKDFSHVLIGGGEYGFDGLARNADLTEVEALADRFKIAALWRVVENMKKAQGCAQDAGE